MTPTPSIVLGLMSGSSLDGLDLALVKFDAEFFNNKKWKILACQTIPYTPKWKTTLQSVKLNDWIDTHLAFGSYLSELVNPFLSKQKDQPQLIAIHGHTLGHEPDSSYSIQLGSGMTLANGTKIPCMDDFRTQDILLGGQGAPIAPTVEHWLFNEYSCFLNIGGIINISNHQNNKINAFDIGAGNQLLNILANEVDLEFDNDGKLASTGTINHDLLRLAKLNPFYHQPFPKSLSNHWVHKEVIPIFQNHSIDLKDRMATAVALLCWELELACEQIDLSESSILLTGGGALNTFLVKEMSKRLATRNIELVVPDEQIVQFKEAVLMALMGYLNISGKNNIFGNSTGSNIDHCAGNLSVPNLI